MSSLRFFDGVIGSSDEKKITVDRCRELCAVLTDRPTVYHGEQIQTFLRVDVDLYRFGSRNMKYMILESRE